MQFLSTFVLGHPSIPPSWKAYGFGSCPRALCQFRTPHYFVYIISTFYVFTHLFILHCLMELNWHRHTRTKIGPCDNPRGPVHRAEIVATGGTSIFKRESAPRVSDVAVENNVVPFIAHLGRARSAVRRGPLSNPSSSQTGIAFNLWVKEHVRSHFSKIYYRNVQ